MTGYLTWLDVCTAADRERLRKIAAVKPRVLGGARYLGLHVHLAEEGAQVQEWLPLLRQGRHVIRMLSAEPATPAQILEAARAEGIRLAERGEMSGRVGESGRRQAHLEGLTTDDRGSGPIRLLPAGRAGAAVEVPSSCCLVSGVDASLSPQALAELRREAPDVFVTCLVAATETPAKLLGLPCGRIAAGMDADLVGWTRWGRVAWVMVGGRFVVPANPPGHVGASAARSAAGARPTAWRMAVARVVAFLMRRPETVEVQYLAGDPAYGRQGIDLRWRIRREEKEERLTIAVDVMEHGDEETLIWHDRFPQLSGGKPDFLRSKAHWLFVVWLPGDQMVCLPLSALAVWFRNEEREFLRKDKEQHCIPVAALLEGIPRARRIRLRAAMAL
ncbi:MAG: hypothetical protein D6775_02110 [Caldilineae bacterium]|nr:MAG: hypothetical protein D6775_02110 [Caldilineae bacterium]